MAQNFIRYCPACQKELIASRLSCECCGLTLSGQFLFNKFTYLEGEDLLFADTFFKYGGSLKEVQREMHLSYPAAKKRLKKIQTLLGYPPPDFVSPKEPILKALPVYQSDTPTIRIIKEKLNNAGGLARIPMSGGGEIAVWYEEYGTGLCAENLPSRSVLTWEAFQSAVSLLRKKNGRAPKGNAMKYKLGEEGLSLDTIEGRVASDVYGVKPGESAPRLVPTLAAVLSFAGLCKNGYGYLELIRDPENTD